MVDVSALGLTIVGGLFGRGRERQVAAADVVDVRPVNRTSPGRGQGAKVYCDIEIVRTGGRKITAGMWILGKRLLDSVVHQITIRQAMSRE
jgi:hypothetical protein